MTASFFQPSQGAPGSGGASRKTRTFKLGEFQLKQLRNGDVYKVWWGGRDGRALALPDLTCCCVGGGCGVVRRRVQGPVCR